MNYIFYFPVMSLSLLCEYYVFEALKIPELVIGVMLFGSLTVIHDVWTKKEVK